MNYTEKQEIAKKVVFRVLDGRRSGNTRYYHDGPNATKLALLEIMKENDVYEGLEEELLQQVLTMLDYFAIPKYLPQGRWLMAEYLKWLHDTEQNFIMNNSIFFK